MEIYTEYSLYGDFNYSENFEDELYNISFSLGCPSSHLQGSNIFLPIAYYLIFFTGFLGNLFVILVMGSKSRRDGRLVDTFIINLALADLIFVLTLPLWAVSASHHGNWDFGNLLCKLSSYIIAVNRFSNIFLLTCMSVDRYLAVVRQRGRKYLRNGLCVRATCAAVWASSLVLAVPSWVYRDVESSGDGLSCVDNNDSPFFLGLSLTVAFVTFVLPVLIIVLCYGTIVKHLKKHCVAAANPRAEARLRHSLKMVLTIIVAFVASWLPFNIFKAIIIGSQVRDVDLSCDTLSWMRNGLLVSSCLAFLNSCVNPAIYFLLDHDFRRRAERLCSTCSGRPKSLQRHNSSASFTNAGTSESFVTSGGRSQPQIFE